MTLIAHSLQGPLRDCGLLRPVDTYLDIGAGIRPCSPFPGAYVRVEPYTRYADVLRAAGETVLEMTAAEALEDARADTVLMLDVIEHMTKDVGESVLEAAKSAARDQVVVFTPNGFQEQHGDAWGMGGDYWQEHRSGWTAADFPGWQIVVNFGGASGILAVWK